MGAASGQLLVVDRGAPAAGMIRLERDAGAFAGDLFSLGKTGEFWIVDAITVWAAPPHTACRASLGDRLLKVELLGGLFNEPPPGEPDCACHSLVPVASGTFAPGASTTGNRNIRWEPSVRGAWQVDFRNLHWSVPGGNRMLFSVRLERRTPSPCAGDSAWAFETASAPAGYRLRLFDEHGLNTGFDTAAAPPRQLRLQVRAHRFKP
jgi:hypothetical protein